MINQKKFFYDYFDGQIIKPDGSKYQMFKLVLTSFVSLFGLFCFLAGFCSLGVFMLLECGMIWNFYVRLDSKISVIFCVIVSSIYFVLACNFRFYANALVYIGFYIPFQMIASSKTYYGGSFVQIKKEMTDKFQVLYVILAVFMSVALFKLDEGLGARFALLDAVCAGCLIASALLRNERYYDYYYYRMFALVLSIILWSVGAYEYGNFELVVVAVMYFAYLIFDVVTNVVQKNTYENEYMRICAEYKRQEDEKIIEKKLKVYKNLK